MQGFFSKILWSKGRLDGFGASSQNGIGVGTKTLAQKVGFCGAAVGDGKSTGIGTGGDEATHLGKAG